MTARYLVARAADADPVEPEALAGHATGYRRWSVIDEAAGATHTGFGICSLDPGAFLAAGRRAQGGQGLSRTRAPARQGRVADREETRMLPATVPS